MAPSGDAYLATRHRNSTGGTRRPAAIHQAALDGAAPGEKRRVPHKKRQHKPPLDPVVQEDVREMEAMLAMIEVSATTVRLAVPVASDSEPDSPMNDDGTAGRARTPAPLPRPVASVHSGRNCDTSGGRPTPTHPQHDDSMLLVSDSDSDVDEAGGSALTAASASRNSPAPSSLFRRPAPVSTKSMVACLPRTSLSSSHGPAVHYTAFIGNISSDASNAQIHAFVDSLTSPNCPPLKVDPRPARARRHKDASQESPPVRGVYVSFGSNIEAIAFVEQVNALNAAQRARIAAQEYKNRVWVSYVDPETGRQVGWRKPRAGDNGRKVDRPSRHESKQLPRSNGAADRDADWQSKGSWRSTHASRIDRAAEPTSHSGASSALPLKSNNPPASTFPPRRVPWRPPGGPLEMVGTGVSVPPSAGRTGRDLAQVYRKATAHGPERSDSSQTVLDPDSTDIDKERPGGADWPASRNAVVQEVDEDRMTASEDEDEIPEGVRVGLGRAGWGAL